MFYYPYLFHIISIFVCSSYCFFGGEAQIIRLKWKIMRFIAVLTNCNLCVIV